MVIKTLSIPTILEEFLKENPDLSPSKILQSKIIEIMENRRINSTEIQRLKRHSSVLQAKLLEATDELHKFKKKC